MCGFFLTIVLYYGVVIERLTELHILESDHWTSPTEKWRLNQWFHCQLRFHSSVSINDFYEFSDCSEYDQNRLLKN